MTLAEMPIPEPGAGEVRIANRAAGAELFRHSANSGQVSSQAAVPVHAWRRGRGHRGRCRRRRHRHRPRRPGTGHAAGEAERSPSIRLCPRSRVFPIPAGMDFPEAAAMPVVYHTSYFALEKRAALRRGEWLLVHAGASGVGMAAIQIGKAMGARIIATAGSAGQARFLPVAGSGAHDRLSGLGWVDRVKEITAGRGADVIYDPVGADIFDLSTKCIAPEGRLLVVGFAGGRIPAIQANRILLKDISIVGVHWGPYVREHPDYPAQVADRRSKRCMHGHSWESDTGWSRPRRRFGNSPTEKLSGKPYSS